jgi:hypothetical protein
MSSRVIGVFKGIEDKTMSTFVSSKKPHLPENTNPTNVATAGITLFVLVTQTEQFQYDSSEVGVTGNYWF